jgi:DNA-3-methyladenine glycosylase I
MNRDKVISHSITMVEANKKRCDWVGEDKLMMDYHDNEWGVPLHDDIKLFELLTLEGAQAGLSWSTVLKKRERYRQAFEQFNPVKISQYGEEDTKRLLADAGIIRNRLKIASTIQNAKQLLILQQEFGSFDKYIWQFSGYKTIEHSFHNLSDLPAKTPESEKMSKDLQERGFRFVGPTICYAFFQAVGMVNDHTVDCFRHDAI